VRGNKCGSFNQESTLGSLQNQMLWIHTLPRITLMLAALPEWICDSSAAGIKTSHGSSKMPDEFFTCNHMCILEPPWKYHHRSEEET
jgi:hypothetical protein